ncbi:heme/hemin ABC transporter substrate-binding protein [Chelativorans sp. YIM 93263]|uniref:heme/hemin ABC transporter substrate-binding protein n=1 Tax=Chelativorans sp. YIM 93263 TaxID=2906648 RepID=UPI002379989E|nr:hemin ABC transporter substrate-binding protein [Chelativorans sp. YIM 93263]
MKSPFRALSSIIGQGPCVFFSALLLSAHAWAAEDLPQPFEDPSRLVVIGGSLTEIVYALGEEENLVARDSTSTFPPEAAELPDIGYMRQLSPEGVLSVSPTAILALEGSGPPETVDVLEKASVPMVIVPESFHREGILDKIRFVGAALNAQDEAEELAADVSQEIAAAQRQTENVTERKRVLFVLSMEGGRLLASGTGTAADGIIAMAGGINAVGVFPGYKQLTDEAVVEARPDVVLLMDRGGDFDTGDEELFANPALAGTPAGQNKAVVRMDGSYLLGFGPRTAGAVRDLATALYDTKTLAN